MPTARERKRGDPRGGRKVYRPEWRDPFPGVLGTLPEKMVLAEMVHRQIPFSFQHVLPDLQHLDGTQEWRVDFYIPSTKLILEVNGNYWHTLEGAPAKDAFRYAALEYHGYKVLVWWEDEILTSMLRLFDEEPTFRHPPVKGPPVKLDNNVDDLKAVRKMNASRRRRVSSVKRRRVRRRRRAQSR